MLTFRRSIARGPDGQPHKVRLTVETGELRFDADPPIFAPEPSYAVRLGVDADGIRRVVLSTKAGDAITVDEKGRLLQRWTGAGGYGFAAIRGRTVLIQGAVGSDGVNAAVTCYDALTGVPTGQFYLVPYSSMGMIQLNPDGSPRMNMHVSQQIGGIEFADAVTDGTVTVGSVAAMRRGGVGIARSDDPTVRMVQRTPTFDGYTNLDHEVLDLGPDRNPWIAIQGSDKWSETPEPDEVVLVPYKELPEVEFLETPRAVHICPGNLVWGVDIEGDRWAYELFEQGRPARILFHDTKVPLDTPIKDEHGTVIEDRGEVVTTLWLAEKTGAAILYYHDRNVDPSNEGQYNEWQGVLQTASELQARYAIYLGVQGYPRLQNNGNTFGVLDTVWCVQKMLDDVRSNGLRCFVFLAVWQGNRVGADAHLAYPEGDLARTFIELIPTINRNLCVDGVVGFGEGRNDVSAWCLDFLRRWRTAQVGLLPTVLKTATTRAVQLHAVLDAMTARVTVAVSRVKTNFWDALLTVLALFKNKDNKGRKR